MTRAKPTLEYIRPFEDRLLVALLYRLRGEASGLAARIERDKALAIATPIAEAQP